MKQKNVCVRIPYIQRSKCVLRTIDSIDHVVDLEEKICFFLSLLLFSISETLPFVAEHATLHQPDFMRQPHDATDAVVTDANG